MGGVPEPAGAHGSDPWDPIVGARLLYLQPGSCAATLPKASELKLELYTAGGSSTHLFGLTCGSSSSCRSRGALGRCQRPEGLREI